MAVGTQIIASMNPMHEVVSRRLFSIGPVDVSNHMIMILLGSLILLVGLPIIIRRDRLVPSGWANFIETICVFLRDEMARPFLGDLTDRFIPFIWTLFFFILTLNLVGMTPVDKLLFVVTGQERFVGGPAATANLWVTGALAITSFFAIHFCGIRAHGVIGYARSMTPQVSPILWPFIFFLEIVSSLVRPVALAVRLFANIFAGHMLLATLVALAFFFKSYVIAGASVFAVAVMSILELLVAFLQAYIFTFLTTIFISFAVLPEH